MEILISRGLYDKLMRLASKSKETKGFLFYKKGIVSPFVFVTEGPGKAYPIINDFLMKNDDISPIMFYTNSGEKEREEIDYLINYNKIQLGMFITPEAIIVRGKSKVEIRVYSTLEISEDYPFEVLELVEKLRETSFSHILC